jgi:hypothetical protein
VLPARELESGQARGPLGGTPRRYHLRIAGAPTDPTGRPVEPSGEPLSTLRGAGAGVGLDTRLISRVIGALVLVALAVTAVIFLVAGLHKNTQITQLRQHGVPVGFTVSGCLGLLGGSGTNGAGYSCQGSFTLDGRRYHEPIPGDAFHNPGSVLRAVTVPGDPALVTTVQLLDSEHTSATVFILPAVLLLLLVLSVGALLLRRRRVRRT